MNQSPRPIHSTPPRADFASRPASTTWESVAVPGVPGVVWIWFKPPSFPTGLALQVPDETFGQLPEPGLLTLRAVLQAVDVDAGGATQITMYGATYEQASMPAVLDQPLPRPAAGVDPQIFVWMGAQLAAAPQVIAAADPAEHGDFDSVFQQIEADWQSSQNMEKQLTAMRKQLAAMLSRLSSLNRDLTPEEGSNADRKDKNDWRDARRWLRECCTNLSRYIREHDVGDVSSAGRRKSLEQIYRQCVVPRQSFDGIAQAQRDFEAYRKLVQNLQSRMQMTLSASTADGERRAQQVLASIAAKIRKNRAKRG